ncbi:MAG TPA: hypothetical protein PK668_09500 [Myxococcota bacterium]|nr:hypothetical protein [Myxococcota bacterium]HRY92783.1 hypothetical protein [Myxococcota bacterium]HSA20422.1 hypothetical protein [Myxococcota bacterium]
MQHKLGAVFFVLTFPLATQAGDARMEIQATTGYLAAPQLTDWQGDAMGGLSVGLDWPVLDQLRLGLRLTFGVVAMPYGSEDGEPLPGGRSGYNPSYFESATTFLPTVAFSMGIPLGERVSLDLALGLGLVSSSEMEFRSFLPNPSAGLGLAVYLGRSQFIDVGLRLQVDAMLMAWFEGTPVLLQPQVGLFMAF